MTDFCDILFSRYSQPFLLIDGFIRTGNLCTFIDGFARLVSEARAWEFWLHKDTGKSWADFKLSAVSQEVDVDNLKTAQEDVTKTFMKGVFM